MSSNSVTTITTLLDAAKHASGSDYKTAQMLDIKPSRIWEWRNGKVNPQPEDFALVAAIAGLDAEEHLVRAVLAKHADTPKGERLLSALGKGLRVIGEGATLVFFVSAASLGLTTKSDAADLPYPATKGNPSAVYYVKWFRAFLKLCRKVESITKTAQPRGDFARTVRRKRIGQLDHFAQA
jgi:hypothetical protein